MRNHFKNKRRGYAVLELLFYISLFIVVSLVVINSLVTMTKSFRETTVQGQLVQSGGIMERISREVKAASNINTINATDLKLDTTDGSGNSKTVEFLLSGSNVQYLENNVLTGNLNPPNITVSGLSFTQITTTEGKAVKIFFTVSAGSGDYTRYADFYDTIVLRGSYE